MAQTKLTIKGITFPDFGDDNSKKNFRLIFFIAFTNPDGVESAMIVSKPDDGAWQWRKPNNDFYLAETIKGDSAELNVSLLKTGGKGFTKGADVVAEFDGQLTEITVQFLDVFDASVGNFLKKNVLPEIISKLKALGIDPIDLLPVPGVFTTVLKDKIKIGELASKFEEFLKKDDKDKLLHTISREYKNQKTLTLKEEKIWNAKKQKKGTYAVKLAVK